MAYNVSQKLRDNLKAIRIALDYQKGNPLSAEDVASLKSYSGFGGIKAILYPHGSPEEWQTNGATKEDLKLHKDIIQLHDLLKENYSEKEYKEIVGSLRNSVLTAFYTPDIVPKTLYTALSGQGIEPKRMYEPSAGSGVFISEAVNAFSKLEQITAVEKDRLTGLVLSAINSSLNVKTDTHITGFEETPVQDNGTYDLVVSNIPFGNFSVYDEAYPDKELSGKIHNYFFAKGLDKLADGGLMAYITTDAFLNSPSNHSGRQYLFKHADFVSLSVMPDNLMKDTGNTEAPNHLLIVQKNENKEQLSYSEKLLIDVEQLKNEYGSYNQNLYLFNHKEVIIGNEVKPGKNQYGQAHETVWQQGDINAIAGKFAETLNEGFTKRFDSNRYIQAQTIRIIPSETTGKKLTYLPMPENKAETVSVQLGLFDTAPAENINRAIDYINPLDETVVQKETARIISTIRTTDNPGHENILLLTAKQHKSNRYLYKLYSNVKEVNHLSANWMDARLLTHELTGISNYLKQFDHAFKYEGDQTLNGLFRFEQKETLPYTRLKSFYKEGTLVVHLGQVGAIGSPDPDFKQAIFHPLGIQGNKSFYESYTALRDFYLELSAKEIAGETINEQDREQLNDNYDRFVSQYGLLNSPGNRRNILEDTAFGMVMLSSLERREGERFVKADILIHSVQQSKERFATDDPIEALAHSLNDTGQVDIAFISAALGLEENETIGHLGNHVYKNPVNNEWETADQYLSGNVVEKLKQAEHLSSQFPDNPQYLRSAEAMQKIQPERIPFDLLDFNLGERWIPTHYYEKFASNLFEQETSINYFPSLDAFKVSTGMNMKVAREFAVTPKSGRTTYGYTMLEHALENTTPFFTYEVSIGDGKTIRLPDNEAIQLAHQKIEQIRTGFVGWLKELPDTEKKYIENLYNDTFNCYVLREFDGSHLNFPGLNKKTLGIEDLYSSQKNAAWRIIQNKGALVDHEVGLGKTLTMIVSAQEMKRLGIVHKPMILALKANVNQIAETYKKAYPNARILFPGENDFTPAKRLRLFHEIKNNNWDCIILTHDQFGKIPQSPEIQKQIFQSELDNIESDLETAKDLGGDISKKMLKGLEIRKNNLEGQLKTVLKNIEEKKDAGINFREMGIDHLFVDEAHKFKNLTFTTRHNRVAGLGNMAGSQKALNMLFAVRTLQERFDADLCVTFLSGTPISNSLTEMYLLFKYLRPKEMERQRIENFDGWAAVFARKTTDFEFSVTNEIIAKERFRHFIKVPELALFYNEITDYKTAKHIRLDKPELNETLVNIKPTPEQTEFIKNLMQFAKTGNGELIGRGKLTPEEDKGRMLIATNYAKKMAADMRLINDRRFSDHPDNKVNVSARKIAEIYNQTTPHKGTQIVFSDIGTPKPNEFNIYDALKVKLLRDFNIPVAEITFIHDWTDKKKPELFRKMNKGEIRILLGSTEKAGTGLNVQERVVAMHHLDIPWKPSELEQRNGRGARQGNKAAKEYYDNKVQNYVYAVEQSLDNYKFNLLKNKQTFISQMKNCELNVRTIDEGAMDEKNGMNFSEYIAILSGDTSLLEKSKLEKKVAVMESLKVSHFREVGRNRYQLESLQNESVSTIKTLEKLTTDETAYKNKLQFEKDGIKSNPIQLDGIGPSDSEGVGKYLISLYKDWKPRTEEEHERKIGNLYGFNLYIRRQQEAYEENGMFEYRYSNSFYAQREAGGIKYSYNNGLPNTDNSKLAARHFLNAIDRVESLKEKYERTLSELKTEIPKLEQLTTKPFLQEAELQAMKSELSNLERQIAIKIQENQLKQHQVQEADAVSPEETPVIKLMPGKELSIVNGHTVSREVIAAQQSEAPRVRSRMRL
ncbi:MAG: DNA methylase [Sphingobacteriia bacterium 24-36-13]|jgi:N12 class adenine-specific DNA methylase|uniref:helicase-related protein n=1 Tax=Chitinophagaceae TaxID=563835 RepID=UPI0009464708|nr:MULTISPECIES: helicase-related protein [Chitinophagaceae]OYY11612.1 MAG: DNA methylase [Sphingobacteriia bacterium 35-36-14]OYZ55432.1 MAG: DNA methylase [Sphingobacteriia bacterium 24-36-13]OZA66343.1 MAG: DNA methylase [Sphingobacteriia bacterium 39-36-14]RWZ89414.1 MAG: DNA methylase [Hydrotalea sp. AMD]HQS22841.1 helicase-related protein [Sediminibacterium sp.]